MKKIKSLIVLLLCLLLAGCGKEGEVPAQASPPSEPPRCLSFAGAEDLEAFFSSAELPEEAFQTYVGEMNYDMNGIRDKEDLAALKERLAPAPFPVVSGGTLAHVDIRPDLDQEMIWIEYRMENGDSARFRFCYSAQKQDRAWSDFAHTSDDVDHGSHWFAGAVDGYDITYWYFGAEEDAFCIIGEQTTFGTWENLWEEMPALKAFSSLEEFEAATALPVYYVPQGIPESYTLRRIGHGAADTAFYYVPEDGRHWDHMELELAISRGECFEFMFRSREADGNRGEAIIWNEQRRHYSWVQDGHELTLKIPQGYYAQPDQVAALCETKTVIRQ